MEIKELLKELVSEEMIKTAIEDAVSKQVKASFDYNVEAMLAQKIKVLINDKADDYIKAEIERVMAGFVRVDDGWGSVKDYGSFDDYVRYSINKSLKDGWNIERRVRDAVDSKLKKYVEEALKNRTDDRVDDVLNSLAKDILKESEEKC